MQTIWIIDDDTAIGDLEQELLERAASSLGSVYTRGRLSLDTASHTVLDESVHGLDPEGIIEIRELILTLNREHGIISTFSIRSRTPRTPGAISPSSASAPTPCAP